jgi:hypothetical protein
MSRTEAANLACAVFGKIGPRGARSRFYVPGLIWPGHRKSVQPTAKRLTTCNYDHFVAAGGWDPAPLEAEPADEEADQRLHPYRQAEGTARPTY